MGIFNFFKDKKTETVEDKFIGRHQQACFVREMLGQEISSLERQIASNKDNSERSEILEKLESLEAYMKSEFYTTQYDVASTFNKIRQISEEGYMNCVLQNDRDMEERCLKILEDVIEYVENKAKKEGNLTEELVEGNKKILDSEGTVGFLVWPELGSLLNTAEEQHAWLIATSLVHKEKQFGRLNPCNVITALLASLDREGLRVIGDALKTMKDRLVKSEKISENDAKKINEMIEAGISENEEIHKLYPNRA